MKHSVRRVVLLEDMGRLEKGQIITLDATLSGKLIKAGKAELAVDGEPVKPKAPAKKEAASRNKKQTK